MGISQSALSYTVRTFDAQLDLYMLTRTTRSAWIRNLGECHS
ncbi:hypothetical protein [Rahnella selenatireducens]